MKRLVAAFPVPENFSAALLSLSRDHNPVQILNSHRPQQLASDRYASYDFLAALDMREEIRGGADCFPRLQDFLDRTGDWIFGGFSYDLKNQLEKLHSDHTDRLRFPDYHFFQPRYVLAVPAGSDTLYVYYLPDTDTTASVEFLIGQIREASRQNPEANTESRRETAPLQHSASPVFGGKESTSVLAAKAVATIPVPTSGMQLSGTVTREEYVETVNRIKQHIARGDIYEMNYCMEFYAEDVTIDPVTTCLRLNAVSPMPFSCFYRADDHYLLCASPERFLKKSGTKIISQPIKGTARRGKTAAEDLLVKEQLLASPKERSENVMIVDLVRNDLSRTALPGSVDVEELFGIYSFQTLHQMISTVVSEVSGDMPVTEIIRSAFPMGSMTGAPKIKAMQLIEEFEQSRRGWYSGATGYFSPPEEGVSTGYAFDLNVVIRSIGYHAATKTLSFMAGSAITMQSDAESEYEECLLKAQSMKRALTHD